MYYFPSPIIENETINTSNVSLGLCLNSGKNALRIALRSYSIPKGSAVAIPAFSCNDVVNAVLEENLKPIFFDVKEVGSYLATYDEERLKSEKVKALIITHLYGFLHPDTKEIISICKRNNIEIVHDAAQSFGIDNSLFGNNPVVYSFGPGKSTTAARGGELLNVKMDTAWQFKKAGYWNNINAKSFYQSRLYGASTNKLSAYKAKLSKQFIASADSILEMTVFQKEMALKAKSIVQLTNNGRKERYDVVKKSISNLPTLSIPYESESGLFFKIVLHINSGTEHFLEYLKQNQIPYCRLADSMDLQRRDVVDCKIFNQSYKSIVEISTERSIPMEEIKRIASVLEKYKNEN